MAVDYNQIAELAERLVTENGRTVSLVRLSETPADSSKPWNGPTGPQTLLADIPAIQLLPNQVRIFGLSALGESTELKGLISYSELVYIVFAGENDLKQYTLVRDGGIDYNIVATQALKPADVTLLGYIGVRR